MTKRGGAVDLPLARGLCKIAGMDHAPDNQGLFVSDGERIRFTSAGVQRFGQRFADCGIDIRAIKTRTQALEALEASFPYEWQQWVEQIAQRKPVSPRDRLERDCLVAIALDDTDTAQSLLTRIDRLNSAESAAGYDPPR